MKKKILTIALILLALAGVYYGTSRYMKQKYEGEISALQAIAGKEPEVQIKETVVEKEVTVSGATIESGLKDIGKLCTAEYYFSHVQTYESTKQVKGFSIPLTKSSFIYSYDGKVLAGVDFGGIKVTKNDDSKVITISVPDPEIISSEVDPDSFKLYDENSNIFNPIKVEDVTDSFAALIKDEEKKAADTGLLDRARENAQLMIKNFVMGTYSLEEYSIEIEA